MARVDLTMFAHVALRPEPELDLAVAALLIASIEHTQLDAGAEVARLDALADEARLDLGSLLAPSAPASKRAAGLVAWLYGHKGFAGDRDRYYDPRNSFLCDVITRRRGIPISLALVVIEVGRRLGIPLEGVSFPGHFLVRVKPEPTARGVQLLDPFTGEMLTQEGLKQLADRVTGSSRDIDPKWLEPATKRQILTRMLFNLAGIYRSRNDKRRLCDVLERLQIVSPNAETKGELERLGGDPTSWPAKAPARSLH